VLGRRAAQGVQGGEFLHPRGGGGARVQSQGHVRRIGVVSAGHAPAVRAAKANRAEAGVHDPVPAVGLDVQRLPTAGTAQRLCGHLFPDERLQGPSARLPRGLFDGQLQRPHPGAGREGGADLLGDPGGEVGFGNRAGRG
jgi:hypothetical protein